MKRTSRKRSSLGRLGLFFALLLLCVSSAACVSIDHLGDRTGDAFERIFAEQAGGRRRLKRMEAELAEIAAKGLIEDKPLKMQGPKLGGR